jgi:hypothetical protein
MKDLYREASVLSVITASQTQEDDELRHIHGAGSLLNCAGERVASVLCALNTSLNSHFYLTSRLPTT